MLIIREMQIKTTMRYYITSVSDSARILCCCGCGIGWQLQLHHDPSLGTFICHRCSPKKQAKKKRKKKKKKRKSLQIINAGEGVEKKVLSYPVGENVNWYNHFEEQYGTSLKKKNLKIVLPYDSAILLLGVYLEETLTQKDTCTLINIVALFTIAKTWKQPKVYQQRNG